MSMINLKNHKFALISETLSDRSKQTQIFTCIVTECLCVVDVLVVDGPSDTGIPTDDVSGYMDSRSEEDEGWQKNEYQVILS